MSSSLTQWLAKKSANMRTLIAILASMAAILMATPVFASAWEYFTYADAVNLYNCLPPPYSYICWDNGQDSVTYTLETDGNLYEYRAVYQISHVTSTPPGPTFYYKLCQNEGTVYNSVTEWCVFAPNNTIPNDGYRITTNWDGCGGTGDATFTPTPNVETCGDIIEVPKP